MKKNKNSFYQIQSRIDGQPRAIKIHDEIGGWGIWAQDFIAELDAIDDEEIELSIFSPGGSILHGIQIAKAIQNHSATFTARIDSFAGSMATVIASVCDKCEASQLATYWIHRAQGVAVGDAEEIRTTSEDIEKMESSLISIYAKKTGASEEEIMGWMKEARAWTAEEAKEYGFVDEVYDAEEFSNSITPALIQAVAKISQTPSQNGKTKTTKKPTMTAEEIEAMKAEKAALETQVEEQKTQLAAAVTEKDTAVATAKKETAERIAGINDLGNKFGFEAEAKAFASEGKSVEDFRAHILNKSPEDWKASLGVKNPTNIGGQETENTEAQAAISAVKARRQ